MASKIWNPVAEDSMPRASIPVLISLPLGLVEAPGGSKIHHMPVGYCRCVIAVLESVVDGFGKDHPHQFVSIVMDSNDSYEHEYRMLLGKRFPLAHVKAWAYLDDLTPPDVTGF